MRSPAALAGRRDSLSSMATFGIRNAAPSPWPTWPISSIWCLRRRGRPTPGKPACTRRRPACVRWRQSIQRFGHAQVEGLVSTPSSMPSAIALQQGPRQQSLHHRHDPGDVGIAAAEIVVAVDIVEEKRAAGRVPGSCRNPLKLLQPRACQRRSSGNQRRRLRGSRTGSCSAWWQASLRARRADSDGSCCGWRATSRHHRQRDSPMQPAADSPLPLHSPPPPSCRSPRPDAVTACRPRADKPPGKARRSAWPSPAADRSAACTNSARCARSTKPSTASTSPAWMSTSA